MSRPLLDVLNNREVERRPVWLMRQAGRYLPEYRSLRQQAGSFLQLCYSPGRACEVTLQPLRRFDLDAAILFSDILVVPHAMGLDLDFVENEGPRLATVRSASDVAKLDVSGRSVYFERVAETVSRVAITLVPDKTLIGFCGAPWTVASYMIEGGSSNRALALRVAAEGPEWFGTLIRKLIDVSVLYLLRQIEAGANVIQIFDSWAGDLPEGNRERWVVKPIAELVRRVRDLYPNFPIIVFARGVDRGHADIACGTEANAVSVEQNVALSSLLAALPPHVGVQGNLSPELLLGDHRVLREAVFDICRSIPKARHIFNLGHGVLQTTDPESVTSMIAAVREYDAAVGV